MSHLKKNIQRKKLTAAFTLACFFLSSVAGQALAAAVEESRQETYREALTQKETLIPSSAGRITDAGYFGGDRVVIVIQDLHCHAEVQRNISTILKSLDTRYGLSKVYQEGAFGTVDTSWLADMPAGEIRQAAIEGLMNNGELTGAEYYSIVAGKPRLIEGLENEKLYLENSKRLQAIFDQSPEVEALLARTRSRLSGLHKTYLCPNNKRLMRLTARHDAGKIDTRKYFSVLFKFARRSGFNTEGYSHITRYLAAGSAERHLNYRLIARQTQAFLEYAKTLLPYAEYKSLQDRSGNFGNSDALYASLAQIARERSIPLSPRFSALAGFLAYNELSGKINPLALIREERRLAQDLMWSQSACESEKEIVYLTACRGWFEDLLTNRITSEDYLAFQKEYPRFKQLWRRYVEQEDLALFAPYEKVANDFYAANIERNTWFLRHSVGCDGVPAVPLPDRKDGFNDNVSGVMAALGGHAGLKVTVTGGFHTAGYTGLLKRSGISYLVITPAVTQSGEKAGTVYRRLIKEQQRISFQTMNAVAISERLGTLDSPGPDDRDVKALAAAVRELRGTGTPYGKKWSDDEIESGINSAIVSLWNKRQSPSADMPRFLLYDDEFVITREGGTFTQKLDPADEAGPRGAFLGIRSDKIIEMLLNAFFQRDEEDQEGGGSEKGLIQARILKYSLGRYLRHPSPRLEEKLCSADVLSRDNDTVSLKIEKCMKEYFAELDGNFRTEEWGQRPDFLPEDIERVGMHINTVHFQELVGNDSCLLVTLGCSLDHARPAAGDGGLPAESLFFFTIHEGLKKVIMEFDRQPARLPKECASADEFIRVLVEHEIMEFTGRNYPQTKAGILFTEFLVDKYYWDAPAEALKIDNRTEDRYHEWMLDRHSNCPDYIKQQGFLIRYISRNPKLMIRNIPQSSKNAFKKFLSGMKGKIHAFFDMDGTLLNRYDFKITNQMTSRLLTRLHNGAITGIVSASSFEDVEEKVLKWMIPQAHAKDMLQYMPVIVNNGGQIYLWDMTTNKYELKWAHNMGDENFINNLEQVIHGVLRNHSGLISRHIAASRKGAHSVKVKRIVAPTGAVNQVTVLMLGEDPSDSEKNRYKEIQKVEHDGELVDIRYILAAELNEKFSNLGLPLEAIVSGTTHINIIFKEISKASGIEKAIKLMEAEGIVVDWKKNTLIFGGDAFVWIRKTVNGVVQLVSDKRDSSVCGNPDIMALNFGPVWPRPGILRNIIDFLGTHHVGLEWVLRMMAERDAEMEYDTKVITGNRLLQEVLRAVDPKKYFAGGNVDVIGKTAVELAGMIKTYKDESRRWTRESAPAAIDKTVFQYLGWHADHNDHNDLLRCSAYKAHGIPVVALISDLPKRSNFEKINGVMITGASGMEDERSLYFGSMPDANGQTVPAIYVEAMQPEDVFEIAAVLAKQPVSIHARIKKAIEFSGDSLFPDIIDFHVNRIPDVLKNGRDFPGKAVAAGTAILISPKWAGDVINEDAEKYRDGSLQYSVSPGSDEEELSLESVRRKIQEVYAPLIAAQESGVMAPVAGQAVVAAVSMAPPVEGIDRNSGVGEFLGWPAVARRPEYRRVPVFQYLPFFTPMPDDESLLRYQMPFALDAALLYLDKVPGAKNHPGLYAKDADPESANREEKTRRVIQVTLDVWKEKKNDKKITAALEKFQTSNNNARMLARYRNHMCRQYGVSPEDGEVFDFIQWQLSLQVSEMTEELHRLGKKAFFWLEISFDPFSIADNLDALGRWIDHGFDGVTITINDPKLFSEGILEKIKATVEKHANGRDITVQIALPDALNPAGEQKEAKIREIKETYHFKVVRAYEDIAGNASGEKPKLDKDDVVMMNSPETGIRPHIDQADGKDLEDIYLEKIEKVEGAGMYAFLFGDQAGDRRRFNVYFRMAGEGSDHIRVSSMLVEAIARRLNDMVLYDPETVYWRAYETAFAETSRSGYAKRAGGSRFTENAISACAALFPLLEQYAGDPAAPLEEKATQAIRAINGNSPDSMWVAFMQRTLAYRKQYDGPRTEDQKKRINAEYAGFVRGIIDGVAMKGEPGEDTGKDKHAHRVLRSLYSLAFSLGLDKDEVARILKGDGHAEAIQSFIDQRSSQSKAPGSIVSAFSRITDLTGAGGTGSAASRTAEEVHKDIWGLMQPFAEYIERHGVLPPAVMDAVNMTDKGSAANREAGDARRAVIVELIRVFEQLFNDDAGKIFGVFMETNSDQLPKVIKAVLEAA